MVILIEEKDIFAFDDISSYAHGCNCAGAMEKGIALQAKEKFPQMYIIYEHLFE